jgi:hypothetical protein
MSDVRAPAPKRATLRRDRYAIANNGAVRVAKAMLTGGLLLPWLMSWPTSARTIAADATTTLQTATRVRDWSQTVQARPSVTADLASLLPWPLQSQPGVALALIAFALVASLLHGSIAVALRPPARRGPPPRPVPPPIQDTRQSCQLLFAHLEAVYSKAERAVMELVPGTPLQSLLLGELNQISQQLRRIPDQFDTGHTALSGSEHQLYWRNLGRRLRAAIRDLNRVCEVATAGGVTFGREQGGPGIPRTLDEAYMVIGANADVDGEILKRLIRALRQCWHPDLASTASDREYREARIRQINAAAEIIAGRRSET